MSNKTTAGGWVKLLHNTVDDERIQLQGDVDHYHRVRGELIAYALIVAATALSGRLLSDGELSRRNLRSLFPSTFDDEEVFEASLDCAMKTGLLSYDKERNKYILEEYFPLQMSREQVEERSAKARHAVSQRKDRQTGNSKDCDYSFYESDDAKAITEYENNRRAIKEQLSDAY